MMEIRLGRTECGRSDKIPIYELPVKLQEASGKKTVARAAGVQLNLSSVIPPNDVGSEGKRPPQSALIRAMIQPGSRQSL